jgi:hypothetical protein
MGTAIHAMSSDGIGAGVLFRRRYSNQHGLDDWRERNDMPRSVRSETHALAAIRALGTCVYPPHKDVRAQT